MELEVLRRLLAQPESPILEFKQSWYKESTLDQKARQSQRDELVKDILSLANGSAATAGETAHLIVGADDKMGTDRRRRLYDITDDLPDSQSLLRRVNEFCEPALERLSCESVEVDGKQLFVVTIPPSPHLHETTKLFYPGGKVYHKHVVFIRVNDDIDIASRREQDAILTMKQRRHRELQYVPPRLFGAFSGAFTGGALLSIIARRDPVFGGPKTSGAVGIVAGGLLGIWCGQVTKDIRRWRIIIGDMEAPGKYLAVPTLLTCIGIVEFIIFRILRRVRPMILRRLGASDE